MRLILAVFVLLTMYTQPSRSQIIVGDCNVVIKSANLNGTNLKFGDIGCPQDPRLALRVTYYWLDATSASFLAAGVSDARLAQILGSKPFVIKNDTYRDLKSLIDKFGVNIEVNQQTGDGNGYYVGVGPKPKEFRSDLTNPRVDAKYTKIRVYDGERPIYFPDAEAIRTTYATTTWPKNYSMYYTDRTDNSDSEGFDASVYLRTVLWRSVGFSEVASYDANIKVAQDKLLAMPKFVIWPQDVSSQISDQDNERISNLSETDRTKAEINLLPKFARNRSVLAMANVGSATWPGDFMHAFGIMEHHAGSPSGWGIVMLPRKLFLQVAVIENIGGAGALFNLQSFSTLKSRRTDLRIPSEDVDKSAAPQPFAPGLVRSGDKVVLPQIIEFRASNEIERPDVPETVAPSNKAASEILTSLRKNPSRLIRTKGAVKISKNASEFRDHSPPTRAFSYRYGTTTTLTHINTDKIAIVARPYDANNVFMVAGFDGGSCPILYIQREGDSEPNRIRSVLTTANGSSAIATERISLGRNVKRIILAEEEPERTIIQAIRLLRMTDSSPVQIYSSSSGAKLDYGHAIALDLPAMSESDELILEVQGYYEPYADKLAAIDN